MKTKTLTALTLTALLLGGATAQSNRPTTSMNAILINTDPAPVQSGEQADINFKIKNTGNTEAKNVEVQIVDSFPFQLKPDRRRNYSLGNVMPEQEYQISAEVLVAENAPDGANDFKLKISHGDFTVTENVPIQVQSKDIELNLANLKTTPSQLTPDMEDAKMELEVVNNGEKQAENVVVEIRLPDGFQQTSSFSTRRSLGSIKPGEKKTADFSFDIEKTASTGQVSVPTNISYSAGDSGTRITREKSFSFYLSGKPQFRITDVESNLETGQTGQIELTVRNTGSEKSSSTRIRVLDSSDLPFSYSSASQYIGTLEPGQEGTAIFDVTTEQSAEAEDYLLDFEVRGVKDTEVYVEDTTVQAEVASSGGGSGNLPLIAGALVVMASGIYVFRGRIRSKLGL